MLIDPFTVTENIVLGMEETKNFGILNLEEAAKKVEEFI